MPACFLKGTNDLLTFDIAKIGRRGILERTDCARNRIIVTNRDIQFLATIDDLRRKLPYGDRPVVAQEYCALETIPKLTDVAGPVKCVKGLDRLRSKVRWVWAGDLFQEMSGEGLNV